MANASDKKEWAKLLYTEKNNTILEIADATGVSRNTISRWIKGDNWEDMKVSLTITRQQQLARLYNQLKEITGMIETRPAGERYSSKQEADTIDKLTTSIDKLEKDISIKDTISVSIEFFDWLKIRDHKKGIEIKPLFDSFIEDKLKKI